MAILARSIAGMQTLRRNNERYGLSLVLLGIPMQACVPVLGSVGSRMVAPIIFSALISLCGALFLGIFTWREIRSAWKQRIRSQLWHLFAVGLFGTALANLFLFWGLSLTTGSNAAILLQVEPVYALLLTFFVLGERPNRAQAVAMVLIMAGAITILCPGTFRVCAGDLLILAVPGFFVIANLLAKSCMGQGLSPKVVVTFRVLWGGCLLALFGLLTNSWHDIPWSSSKFITSVVSVGLFGMVLNGLFWYMAISRVSLNRCTTIMSAYPVLAVVCSWAFLGESPQWTQVAGLTLVLTGIYKMCQRTSCAIPSPKT